MHRIALVLLLASCASQQVRFVDGRGSEVVLPIDSRSLAVVAMQWADADGAATASWRCVSVDRVGNRVFRWRLHLFGGAVAYREAVVTTDGELVRAELSVPRARGFQVRGPVSVSKLPPVVADALSR